MALYGNDFAFLSDAIASDVLQVAHFERLRGNYVTMRIGGRWGEIAETFSNIKLIGTQPEGVRYAIKSRDFCSTLYSLEQAKEFSFNCCSVDQNADFGKIMDFAPNFYESMIVKPRPPFVEPTGLQRLMSVLNADYQAHSNSNPNYRPQYTYRDRLGYDIDSSRNVASSSTPATAPISIPKQFLEALRPRFTTIKWKRDSNEALDGEVDFFKRQLRSPHLRILESDSAVLAQAEFTALLADFVSKPGFEKLSLAHTPSTPQRLFEAAYEAWIQRKDYEHLESSIDAKISHNDLGLVTAKFPDFRWNEQEAVFVTSVDLMRPRMRYSYSEKHPTADLYEMSMVYDEDQLYESGDNRLTMRFSQSRN